MNKNIYTYSLKGIRVFITIVAAMFLLANPIAALAQGRVTIVVKDVNNSPVIGASAVVDGTTRGGMTNSAGEVVIVASPSEIIRVSFLGYVTQSINVGAATRYEVTLEEDALGLDDIVVIGYGSMDRKRVTTSVTSVQGDDLTLGIGGASVATALQGKIPGMIITGNSSPNQGSTFQLRGVASVKGSASPLIVIDGIPSGDYRSLVNEDIESIDVLQDASAGAIYGTRAAGGVILITTKKPKAGKMTLTYNGEIAMETLRKTPNMLSASDWVTYGKGADYGYDTDWYREMTRNNPISHKHTVTMSGGSEVASVYASFMTQDYDGILLGDGRKDYSGRINTSFKMLDGIMEMKLNASYREAQRDQRHGNLASTMRMNPTIPVMDPDNPGEYNVKGVGLSGTDTSPVANIMLQDYNGKDSWLLFDANLKVNLAQGISLNAVIGYQKADWHLSRYYSQNHRGSIDNERKGEAYQGFDKSWWATYEAYGNFDRTYNGHRIEVTGGYSFWEKKREYFNMTNYDFTSEGKAQWDMGTGTWLKEGKAGMSSGKDERTRLIAGFGRVNYTFKERYMLSASLRHEGSTSFGRNNRWGNFWGVSAGWRAMEEEFMRGINWLDDLKVRASYGVTGNDKGISSDVTTYMLSSDVFYPSYAGGDWITSYGGSKNVNYDLKWEEKHELNVGIDYAVLNHRLWGSVDYYNRQVKDLLYDVRSPQPPMVYNTQVQNVGTLENKGIEVTLGGDIVRSRNFQYSSTIRLSHNKTKIKNTGMEEGTYIQHGDNFPSPGNPGNGTRIWADGSGFGQFFVYKWVGFDDEGRYLLELPDGEVVTYGEYKDLSTDDKVHMGNAMPKVIASWEHNLRYKNWELGISLRGWLKYDVYSQFKTYFGIDNGSAQNVFVSAMNKNRHITQGNVLTSWGIEDATWVKIDAINLAYTLDLAKHNIYLSRARFFLTIRDLYRFTNFSGMNPEVDITGLYPGIEWINKGYNTYPQTIRFTLGVQLTF